MTSRTWVNKNSEAFHLSIGDQNYELHLPWILLYSAAGDRSKAQTWPSRELGITPTIYKDDDGQDLL